MTEDVQFFLGTVVVVVVLCAVLFGVRRAISSPSWRDVLGITITFIVLGGIGFLMIVGEHSLG